MKIKITTPEQKITVRDLVEGFAEDLEGGEGKIENTGADGVVGYNGQLDIRPGFQRNFVYKLKQRDDVIDTIINGYPLGLMYWIKNKKNAKSRFGVLDGQQRTISLCRFVRRKFRIKFNDDYTYFNNLPEDLQNEIYGYELDVRFCEGDDREMMAWFRRINTVGEALKLQEMRNAIYSAGKWLADAKAFFSKVSCKASRISKDYVDADVNRQELLEIAIKWLTDAETDEQICAVMSDWENNSDGVAEKLKENFKAKIDWIRNTFPVVRAKEMKRVDWNRLHREHSNKELDPVALEKVVKEKMADEEVFNKAGAYEFALTGDEDHLDINPKQFPEHIRRTVFEQQHGRCAITKKEATIEEMEGVRVLVVFPPTLPTFS